MQERGAATRVADDEYRPVDRLLAVAWVDEVVEAQRRCRNHLPQLQKQEGANRPHPHPERHPNRPVQTKIAPHSAVPHRGGARDRKAGCGAGDDDLVAALDGPVLQAIVERDGPRGARRVAEQRVGVYARPGPRAELAEYCSKAASLGWWKA